MANAFTRSYPWESTFIHQMERRREAAGWTQTDLARKLKVRGLPFHQQTIQRIEKGERAVRLDEAFVIAEVFDVSLDAMLTHFEGPMDSASTAIDRVRRYAEGVTDSFSDAYTDFLNEFDLLVVAFDDLLEAARHKPTPEVVWVAAWLLKCGRVIEAMGEAEIYAESLYIKSGDWQDSLRGASASWDHVSWIVDESADIWQELPDEERPHYLMDLNPTDLQKWITGKTDGEHTEEA